MVHLLLFIICINKEINITFINIFHRFFKTGIKPVCIKGFLKKSECS